MKFSFSLIKKYAPGNYSKEDFVEKFNAYAFETTDVGGDILDVSIPPNRFSSAASHLGLAREASAIFNVKFIDPTLEKVKIDFKDKGLFKVNIKDKNICPRYIATYVSDVKIAQSPEWLKNVLISCGLRPINNVVDIMNYVMLEVGQPLHTFDADKISGGIIVRRAKPGEKIETIDKNNFTLNENILIIADEEKPLAIAGIKGGRSSEVSLKTTRILVESANFDGVNIYKSSRNLNLKTDASVRFSHNLSPELADLGMKRVLSLLKELCGAKIYKSDDVYGKKQPKKVIKFDLVKIEKIIGIRIKKDETKKILNKLGFSFSKNLVIVPALRNDIETIEDLTEEIARLKNLNDLPALPPKINLAVANEDDIFIIKNKIGKYLSSVGYSEVYNYSFLPKEKTKLAPAAIFGVKKSVAIANPLSEEFMYLRNSLAPYLEKNLVDNLRFFGEVRIFETGKVFGDISHEKESLKVSEKPLLGIAIHVKEGFLELKGVIDGLFGYLGLTDWFMPDLNFECNLLENNGSVRIETGDHSVLGYAGILKSDKNGALLEIDLEKLVGEVVGEKEYEPISKYPSIERDISMLVSRQVRVGRILELIQESNTEYIDDVDLMDFYEDEKFEGKKSLTFRIVFQAKDRTLTDAETDREMEKIINILKDGVEAEIR